jgi:hypothetical protein
VYPGDRGVGDRCQALASEVVDHDQDSEAPGGEAVRGEVERPALVRRFGQRQRGPRPGGAFATTSATTNRQAFLTIYPAQLLMVHAYALCPAP